MLRVLALARQTHEPFAAGILARPAPIILSVADS
jgi:hypothetical protein